MADMEAILRRVRDEVLRCGSQWLEDALPSLTASPVLSAGESGPRSSGRRSRPPERLSPAASPVPRRRRVSPSPAASCRGSGASGGGRSGQAPLGRPVVRSGAGRAVGAPLGFSEGPVRGAARSGGRARRRSGAAVSSAPQSGGQSPAGLVATRAVIHGAPSASSSRGSRRAGSAVSPAAAAGRGAVLMGGDEIEAALSEVSEDDLLLLAGDSTETLDPLSCPLLPSGVVAGVGVSGVRSPPLSVQAAGGANSAAAESSDGVPPVLSLEDVSVARDVRSRPSSGVTAAGSEPVRSGGAAGLVWIVGHSYVTRGAVRAGVRPAGRQLGLDGSVAQVRWLGKGGMRWSELLSRVQFFVQLDRSPDILVVHLGGNDLGVRRSRDLIRDIKLDLLRLWSSFPDLVLVWSEMVARQKWRQARSVVAINKARIKVNKAVSKFVARNGGLVARHRDLEEGGADFVASDGIHLNGMGMDLWLLELKETVERALRLWRNGDK
ncbi:uncharacterized protein LOC130356936 [Hyla sarda]|uniref:uncharacterized protein LOC130283791 n=1 Tax=Hyla sarda TaxID=327740 RepID=UPI0024C3EAB1|nr:uncharacterized protein LOC130283791 [Hyla sarda]XP_056415090.1 uncharacterized protein LOC130356936 [Hyla sarda]